jgi:ABC-type dipeptide/oligopeptide/nickel transport system permease component
MARHLGIRIALGAVTVAGVILLTFVLMFLVPGDPARGIAGPRADAETLALVRANLNLDASWLAQLWSYATGVVQGDLGVSYVRREAVTDLLMERLPATALLALTGLAISVVVGSALGVWDGLRARRSRLLATVNVGLLSIPTFSMAFTLLLVFGYKLEWFPITGGTGAANLVLPAVTLGLWGIPYYASVVRDGMQEVLAAPYTRTAVAKGLPRRSVITRHVLRNALSPVVTMVGLDFAIYMSGVVFVENVFAWPGIGQLQTQAFADLDRPLLMGTVVVAAIVVVAANLAADTTRMLLDPRTREQPR